MAAGQNLFLSYGLYAPEINFSPQPSFGLVGGIGCELMTNTNRTVTIGVSITLLLITPWSLLLDMLSGRLRQWVLEGK